MLPKRRITTHPGEVLQEEFLTPLSLSQSALARHIGVKPFVINELIHGKRGISARMAAMLSRALGTTPEFWTGLQSDFEITSLMQSQEGKRVSTIRRLVPE
jgi:addiction module HigA family antidote